MDLRAVVSRVGRLAFVNQHGPQVVDHLFVQRRAQKGGHVDGRRVFDGRLGLDSLAFLRVVDEPQEREVEGLRWKITSVRLSDETRHR